MHFYHTIVLSKRIIESHRFSVEFFLISSDEQPKSLEERRRSLHSLISYCIDRVCQSFLLRGEASHSTQIKSYRFFCSLVFFPSDDYRARAYAARSDWIFPIEIPRDVDGPLFSHISPLNAVEFDAGKITLDELLKFEADKYRASL